LAYLPNFIQRGAVGCQFANLAELPGEAGMTAEEKSIRQIWFLQAPDGFRKASRREIEEGQFLKKVESSHGGVECAHQPGCGIELKRRRFGIFYKSRLKHRGLTTR